MGDLWSGSGNRDVPQPEASDAAPDFTDPEGSDYVRVDAPVAWLVGAGVAQLAAALLFAVPGTQKHLGGYALAALISATLVASFWLFDTRARTSRSYVERPILRHASAALLVSGIALAALHVWFYASEIAR